MGRHHLEVGLSALRAVDRVVDPGRPPGSVLDFACGYGRVLRWLCGRFKGAVVTASEIDAVAVDYCTGCQNRGRCLGLRHLPYG